MTATAPLLALQDVSVKFGRARRAVTALSEVSFEVRTGETLGLVGESGSGKSTIARAIMGLAPVSGGAITFAGADITTLSFRQRRKVYEHVQIVFQDPYSSLNPSRTVGSTLAEPLLARGKTHRKDVAGRVRAMLERVHLPTSAADRYPSEFSGGQRQRIAIARALMPAPRLVICDEAVSALDLSVQAQILNLLTELQTESGLSFLFISHDLEVVRHICDRVVVLYGGRVMEIGGADRVAIEPAHPFTKILHEAAPLPDPAEQRRRRARPGARPAELAGGPGTAGERCSFAARCPYAIPRCVLERPHLRDIGDGVVACHRHPEWRRAAPRPETPTQNATGASDPDPRMSLTREQLQ